MLSASFALRGSAISNWSKGNDVPFHPTEKLQTTNVVVPKSANNTSSIRNLFEAPVWHRRQDEVERVGTLDCRLTTSLSTPYRSRNTAKGTMFTVFAKDEIEVLGVEFEANDYNVDGIVLDDLSVQVYFKEGEFAGFTGDESLWTLLADAQMFISPDDVGAIVPASSFTPVTLEPEKMYSFYLSFPTEGVLRIQNSQELLGNVYQSNDVLDLFSGVAFDTGPFPSTFSQVADFAGRLHYRSLRSCSQALTLTEVTLSFAINDDPETEIMEALASAVEESINALAILNPDLSRFKKNHMLELKTATHHFQGLNPEICAAAEFDKCSLVDIKVNYNHLQTIEPGDLQKTILLDSSDIANSVSAQVDFDVKYVGQPITKGEYLVTLKGVPKGVKMNPIQKRYFERVTANFLKSFSEMAVYTVEVTDEVVEVESGIDGDEMTGVSRRHFRGLRSLQSKIIRNMQQLGESVVVVSAFGSGADVELNTAILQAVGENEERYKEELILQQLRPGEINQQDSGSHFEGIRAIVMAIKPEDFNSDDPILPEDLSEEEADFQLYIILCYIGVVLSLLFIMYRLRQDCCPSKRAAMEVDSEKKRRFFRRRKPLKPQDTESDSSSPEKEPQEVSRRAPGPSRSFSGPFQRQNIDNTAKSAASNDGSQTPRNRAGENGRGIRPTRSLDTLRNGRPQPRRRDDLDSTANSSASNGGSQAPRNRAGENGRGIRPTRSLDTLQNGRPQPRRRNDPDSTAKSSASNDSSQAPRNTAGENGRGVRPTKSLPMFQKGQTPEKKENRTDRKMPPPKNSSFSGLFGRNSKSEDTSKPVETQGKIAPKNKAGENGRGVRPTRSLPTFLKRNMDETNNKPGISNEKTDTTPKPPSKPMSMENLSNTDAPPKKGKKKKKKKNPNAESSVGAKKKGGGKKKKKKTKKIIDADGEPSAGKKKKKTPKRSKSAELGSTQKKKSPKRSKSVEANGKLKANSPKRSKSAELSPAAKTKNLKRSNPADQPVESKSPTTKPSSKRKGIAATKSLPLQKSAPLPKEDDESDWSSSDSDFANSSDDDSSVDYSVGTFESFSNVQRKPTWDEEISSSEEESSVDMAESVLSKAGSTIKQNKIPKSPSKTIGTAKSRQGNVDDDSVRSKVSQYSKASKASKAPSKPISPKNEAKNSVSLKGVRQQAQPNRGGLNRQDSVESIESAYDSEEMMPNSSKSSIRQPRSNKSARSQPRSRRTGLKRQGSVESVESAYDSEDFKKQQLGSNDSDSEESDFSLGQNPKNQFDSDSESDLSEVIAFPKPEPKPLPKNQSGMNGRGVKPSKSLPAPTPVRVYDEDESSEESDLEEESDKKWGSLASISSSKKGSIGAKSAPPPQKTAGSSAFAANKKLFESGSASTMSPKSVKSLPQNSSVAAKTKATNSKSPPKRFVYPNKHKPTNTTNKPVPVTKKSSSNDETAADSSSKYVHPNKHLPKNRSGLQGRGVRQTRSLDGLNQMGNQTPNTIAAKDSSSVTSSLTGASSLQSNKQKRQVGTPVYQEKSVKPQIKPKDVNNHKVTRSKSAEGLQRMAAATKPVNGPQRVAPAKTKSAEGLQHMASTTKPVGGFKRAPPAKTKSAEGLQRMAPGRSKSADGLQRMAPGRSKSADGLQRMAPGRTKSQEFGKYGKIKFIPKNSK